jgi:hypothetical protein
MSGPVGYRTEDQNHRSALSAVAQAEPPVLLSTPFRPSGAGAIRAAPPGSAPRSEGSPVVYPAAGGLEVLLDLVREFESKGPTYRQARQWSFKASYTNHYRAGLVQILEALELRSNNTVHRPVLEALELIKRYKAEHSPATCTTPAGSASRSTG